MKTAPIMTITNRTEYGQNATKKKWYWSHNIQNILCWIYVIKRLLKIFMAKFKARASGFRSQYEKHPNLYNIFKKGKA